MGQNHQAVVCLFQRPKQVSRPWLREDGQRILKLARDKWDSIRLGEEASARAAKPNADQYQRAIALREAMIDWCLSNRAEPDAHDRLVKELEWLRQNFAKRVPPRLQDYCITWDNGSSVPSHIDPIVYFDQATKLIWQDRLDVLRSLPGTIYPWSRARGVSHPFIFILHSFPFRAKGTPAGSRATSLIRTSSIQPRNAPRRDFRLAGRGRWSIRPRPRPCPARWNRSRAGPGRPAGHSRGRPGHRRRAAARGRR